MAKMLENSCIVRQCHGGKSLLCSLPLLTQRKMTATVAGRHHFSENGQGNLWRGLSTEVQANWDTDTLQRFFSNPFFLQKFQEAFTPTAASENADIARGTRQDMT